MKRGRLALLGLVPVLILLAGEVASYRVETRAPGDPRTRLTARAEELGRRLAVVGERAHAAARRARDSRPEAARDELPGWLAGRLEGAGVLRGGRYEAWSGTPAEAALFGEGEATRVLTRGIRTSLLARSEPDAALRTGVASFVLEIRSGAVSAEELLPGSAGGIAARWDFDAETRSFQARYEPGPPATLTWPWRLDDGRPLAALVLEEQPVKARAARTRALARAWAGLAAAVAAACAVARRSAAAGTGRLFAIVAAVLASRAALAGGRTLEVLAPRSLGSPSLYGRGDALSLFASPLAMLVTAACAYFVATAVARFAAAAFVRGRRAAMLPLAGVALAAIVSTLALAGSLARDARVRVPRLDPDSPGTLLLALAAACLLAGAAELVATVVATPRYDGSGSARPARLAVAAALVPLSFLFLVQLYRTSDRVVDERLRSEFAPLVLEQSARRRVALAAAIGDAATAQSVAEALTRPPGDADTFLAYELWIGSDLFHQGFASSLDLYDASGARRGHFGFAFPQVGGGREIVPRGVLPGGAPLVESETVPAGASLLRVLHAEAAIPGPSGAIVGRVVGHVLEDPSNLPFLPGSAPYVDALGSTPSRFDDPLAETPDYVLFDEDGRVVVSTVHQPPAATPSLRAAAAAGRREAVDSGDVRYRALPLAEGGRLHLLLTPAPTILDALGDGVRLLLLGVSVVGFAAIVSTLSGRGGGAALLDVVRGSFYFKLLAAVVFASVIPLVGLAVFLRAYVERRGEASLADSAAAVVGTARRVVEDYQSVGEDDPTVPRLRINDEALWWLRRVVGQEIHVYEDGTLAATSKPEMFDSGLLLKRLPGEVDREVVRGGRPFVVRREHLGAIPLPVAYARVDERGGSRDAVIAVPLVIEQREFSRSVDRLRETLLLLTTALAMLLAASAAMIARSVAGPVRRLADASRRIAGGDYGARLATSSRDEMGSLVKDFNRMAEALAGQRADLERRRDYIEALLRHATTGVVSTDAAGRVVTINPAAEALLAAPGGPPRRGENLADTLRLGDSRRPLAEALADPRAATATPLEVDLGGKDRTRRLRVVRVPLPDPAGHEAGALVLLDDVTTLMKSNQLAAWAEMARAIAHEIKNPLTPIQLSADHARKLLRDRGVLPAPEIDACLDTIVRQVRELRDISRAFSTYARIPDLALESVDPGTYLREVVSPYRSAPPAGIRIDERYAGTGAILADRRILARAIVNLIENALEAMPDGGTLGIASHATDPGGIVIEVSDTGTGLTPDVRARLFEPYFSTKGSGTGLGLAIVRRVVLGHGGSIDVESTPGRGTVFRIRLPEAPPL